MLDGPSLPSSETLAKINCFVIGANLSFVRIQPDVYVLVDSDLIVKMGRNLRNLVPRAKLRLTSYPCDAAVTPKSTTWSVSKASQWYFSTDIARDGWVLCCVMPCCVQVAAYLGFKEIIFCGLDLKIRDTKHFYPGGRTSNTFLKIQSEWLRLAMPTIDALGIRLINTNRNAAEDVSEKIEFSKVFR